MPQILFASLEPIMFSLLRPKSLSLMKPSSAISTFSGFKLSEAALLSVDDIFGMQVLYCQQDLSSVESSDRFFKSIDITEMVKQFAARAVFQQEVQFLWVLEGIFHVHDKWMRYVTLR